MTEIKIGFLSIGTVDIILLLLSWFIYRSFEMVLAFALLMLVLNLLVSLGFIPIAGNIAYIFLGKFLMGKIIALTGLTHSWLIPFVFWINFGLGVIISIIILLIIIVALKII